MLCDFWDSTFQNLSCDLVAGSRGIAIGLEQSSALRSFNATVPAVNAVPSTWYFGSVQSAEEDDVSVSTLLAHTARCESLDCCPRLSAGRLVA
jgi:hypothetical protein